MATIITKSQGSGYSLSYAELAQLRDAAAKGNTAAAIRLAQLPATERRLADMLVKSFGEPEKKARKQKEAKVTKAQKAEADFWKSVRPVPRNSPDWAAHERAMAETAALVSMASSDNPSERETAKRLLGR